MLPLNEFKAIVKDTVLCAIDLIVKDESGEVLLGLRKNAPAKGYWFVPGGRIYKDETLKEALARIALDEIGIPLTSDDIRLLGIYDHIYQDNFFGDSSFGTHYIVFACEVLSVKKLNLTNSQHDNYKFLNTEDLLTSENVHVYTKNYFVDNPENLFIKNL